MFLKSLVLKGFKSFADTTKLDFEPGVTVVVGPNGSGKSNLVDAIAWVLGSQSPRSVRSAKMEDVIFAGSKKRSALGRAEVALIMDNESGMLPLDFSEVVISRALFRTGESEYCINKTPCRLMDLADLLSEGGMGQHQHTIVSQGEVDGVLNDRSEDRRMIIEEAAGVLKHRKRRERAEKRLMETDMDLARLRDLLKEVSRQLEPLERQAEAARKHGQLLEHLNQLRIFVAGKELKGLRQEKDFLSQKHKSLKIQETELLERQSILNVEIQESEDKLNEFGMDSSGETLASLESLKAKTLNALDLLKQKTIRLGTETQVLGQIEQAQKQKAEYEAELAEISDKKAELEYAQNELSQILEQAKAQEKELTELEVQLLSQENIRDEAESQLAVFTAQLEELKSKAQEASREVKEQKELLSEKEAEKNRWASKLEAMDMVRNFSGAGKGSDEAQILGDQVTADPGYERAVAAALGLAVNAILVEDKDGAIQVLESLRQSNSTGFLLVNDKNASSSSRDLTASSQNLIRSKATAAQESLEPLLDSILDSVFFAETWTEALQLHLDTEKTVVSLYGDKFSKDGWQLGNTGVSAETALTAAAQKAESAEAKASLSELEGFISPMSSRLNQLREKEQEILIALKTLEANIQTNKKKIQSAGDQKQELAAKKAEIEGSHTSFVSRKGEELSSINAQLANFSSRQQKIEIELSAADQKLSMLSEQLGSLPLPESSDAIAGKSGSFEPVESISDPLLATVDKLSIVSEINQFFSDALYEVEAQLSGLREKRKQETQESRTATQRLNENRRKRENVSQELTDLRQAVSRAEITFAEVSAHLENAVQNLERDLDCSEEKAMSAACPEIPEGESPEKQISDIEQELRLIGPVNHLALTEYENIKNRHSFLFEQMEDIKSARKELRKLIRTIDMEMANAFESAFSDIAENFETLFQIAFPGGEGRITLSDSENLLETGVDISARPGDKKIKRLSLLSGGERSLVALTFLFAVLKSRPSPFCILDEVDAALDDINLCRFLDLVKVLAGDTQLLIVSHQKRTMESADFLYGISMPTEGVTKAISERKAASI